MIVALFLFGLEDVGTRIEQPFDSLPLWQYCDTIDASCKQLLAQSELMKQAWQPRVTAFGPGSN
jgi:predicted membrane chloride channel (bestrophin family)